MLYVNNEEVKPNSQGWARYQKFREEVLPNLPETVVFKKAKPRKTNPTGLHEPDPLIFIPYEAIDYDPEYGSQHWRYCVSAPQKNESGKWTYRPLGENFKRSKAVEKTKQPDLIFFMMELCHKVKDKTIVCENLEQEAISIIQKDEQQAAVKYMIYHETSPISPQSTGNEDLLRMIAAAWGISTAHNKRRSIAEIRVELFAKVDASEKSKDPKGGYNLFLSEISSRERLTLKANIQRAVDNKSIEYHAKDFTWYYANGGPKIKTISSQYFDKPTTGLFEYFINDETKRKIFYGTLDDKYEIPETPLDKHVAEEIEAIPDEVLKDVPTIEELDAMEWVDLQKMGNDLGVRTVGVKKEKILEDIRQETIARSMAKEPAE